MKKYQKSTQEKCFYYIPKEQTQGSNQQTIAASNKKLVEEKKIKQGESDAILLALKEIKEDIKCIKEDQQEFKNQVTQQLKKQETDIQAIKEEVKSLTCSLDFQFEITVRKSLEPNYGSLFCKQYHITNDLLLFYYINNIMSPELRKEFEVLASYKNPNFIWNPNFFIDLLESYLGQRGNNLRNLLKRIGYKADQFEVNIAGDMKIQHFVNSQSPYIVTKIGNIKQILSDKTYNQAKKQISTILRLIEEILFAFDEYIEYQWSNTYYFEYEGIIFFGKLKYQGKFDITYELANSGSKFRLKCSVINEI